MNFLRVKMKQSRNLIEDQTTLQYIFVVVLALFCAFFGFVSFCSCNFSSIMF